MNLLDTLQGKQFINDLHLGGGVYINQDKSCDGSFHLRIDQFMGTKIVLYQSYRRGGLSMDAKTGHGFQKIPP